jgi:hypothetical protein
MLASLLPYIITGMFAIAAVAFLLSLQQLRRGRKGPYWRIRRAAGQRGGQLFLFSIALFGVAGALALFSGLADLAYQRLTNTLNSNSDTPKGVVLPSLTPTLLHTFTPTSSTTPTPTYTITATATRLTETPRPSATVEPSATLTATSIPSMTFTATATFESVLVLTPALSQQQPRSGATIEIMAAAASISPDELPVDPTQQFPAGVQRIYLFIDFQRMDDGVSWSRVLFRDGVPIQGQSYLWSLGEEGSSYFFFGSDEGYPPGEYEVRLFLSDTAVSQFKFSVTST